MESNNNFAEDLKNQIIILENEFQKRAKQKATFDELKEIRNKIRKIKDEIAEI